MNDRAHVFFKTDASSYPRTHSKPFFKAPPTLWAWWLNISQNKKDNARNLVGMRPKLREDKNCAKNTNDKKQGEGRGWNHGMLSQKGEDYSLQAEASDDGFFFFIKKNKILSWVSPKKKGADEETNFVRIKILKKIFATRECAVPWGNNVKNIIILLAVGRCWLAVGRCWLAVQRDTPRREIHVAEKVRRRDVYGPSPTQHKITAKWWANACKGKAV